MTANINMKKIAMITASLGNFDQIELHVPQSLAYDYFLYTDENFPKLKTMAPRLQAKIPKCFAWELVPNYDYYFWIDGSLILTNPDSLKYFYDNCQGYDIVTLKHPRRNTVKQESRYLERGLDQESRYLVGRYLNEQMHEQMIEIKSDPEFVDNLLVIGGVFMYKNTPKVHAMLTEWWYHSSRYTVMDQLSFPYLLKKFGLKVNVRPDIYSDCPYLKQKGHKIRS